MLAHTLARQTHKRSAALARTHARTFAHIRCARTHQRAPLHIMVMCECVCVCAYARAGHADSCRRIAPRCRCGCSGDPILIARNKQLFAEQISRPGPTPRARTDARTIGAASLSYAARRERDARALRTRASFAHALARVRSWPLRTSPANTLGVKCLRPCGGCASHYCTRARTHTHDD